MLVTNIVVLLKMFYIFIMGLIDWIYYQFVGNFNYFIRFVGNFNYFISVLFWSINEINYIHDHMAFAN